MKIHHNRNYELMITVHLLMRIQGHPVDMERNQQKGDITQRKEKLEVDLKNPEGVIIASMNLCTHIVTGHKRQRSEDSNSDECHSFRKHNDYSKGSDSSLDSN